jgi:hypothetical protein
MTESLSIWKEGSKWHAASLRLLLDSLSSGAYRVTVTDNTGKRSGGQNDLLHAYFRIYARALNDLQATGEHIHRWDMEDVKEWMLGKFAPTIERVDPNGEIHTRRKRSHEMTQDEASEFVDTMALYMRDTFGMEVPERDEQQTLPI